MAERFSELGAAILVNRENLTPEVLKESLEKVLNNPVYLENIMKISDSFIKSGGYKKAVEEIFAYKKERNIS